MANYHFRHRDHFGCALSDPSRPRRYANRDRSRSNRSHRTILPPTPVEDDGGLFLSTTSLSPKVTSRPSNPRLKRTMMPPPQVVPRPCSNRDLPPSPSHSCPRVRFPSGSCALQKILTSTQDSPSHCTFSRLGFANTSASPSISTFLCHRACAWPLHPWLHHLPPFEADHFTPQWHSRFPHICRPSPHHRVCSCDRVRMRAVLAAATAAPFCPLLCGAMFTA